MVRTLFAMIALAAASTAAAQETQSTDPRVALAQPAFIAFFTASDAGDAHAAYAMLSPRFQANTTLDEYVRVAATKVGERSALIERRIMRTTVYDNPANSPGPGLYIAFDFVGWFEHADLYCGYLIAFQPPSGGAFTIMRVEETTIDHQTAAAIDADPAPPTSAEAWAGLAGSVCPIWLSAPASRG
jgi:hypothetical protein